MIISSRISLNWIYVNVSIVSLFKINARIVSPVALNASNFQFRQRGCGGNNSGVPLLVFPCTDTRENFLVNIAAQLIPSFRLNFNLNTNNSVISPPPVLDRQKFERGAPLINIIAFGSLRNNNYRRSRESSVHIKFDVHAFARFESIYIYIHARIVYTSVNQRWVYPTNHVIALIDSASGISRWEIENDGPRLTASILDGWMFIINNN